MIIWAAGAAVLLLMLLIIYMLYEARRVDLRSEEIQLLRLPDGFNGMRIFFITDIHRRMIPESLIQACMSQGGADLVLIGGDLTERGVPLARIRSNMRMLGQIAPVYAVYGNHDHNCDMKQLEVLLQEEGVRVLVNENIVLEQKNGSRMLLCGVDDPITGKDQLPLALADPWGNDPERSSLCTILLSHDPLLSGKLPANRIDLMLSGHTHGGQIALPIIGPLYLPRAARRLFKGWYNVPGQAEQVGQLKTRLFVSCGFGTSKMPLRLGTPPEAHLFKLVAPVQANTGRSAADQ